MNGHYTIYKREPDGTQGDMIPDFTLLEIDLYWGKRSKIRIEGVSPSGEAQLAIGNGVDIYRNGKYFLGGIIDSSDNECPKPATGIKNWTTEGEDDSVLLTRRQILADPVNLTFDKDTYDKAEGYAYNRLIHYVYNNGYRGTSRDRWFSDQMILPSERPVGTEDISAYRSVQLAKALSEIGKEDELFPTLVRDPKTGAISMIIPEPRDMTEEIVISPNYGNVTKWSRKDKLPDYNAVWVVSGEYSKGRLYVYAEDLESIAAYGRIEAIVSKSDIKVWEDSGQETAEASEGENNEEEEHLTEEDVRSILEAEARTLLLKHGVKRSWTVEVAETQEFAFEDNWKVGDRVTCVIDGEKFETQITAAKITYEKGLETVEPTVGDIERGLFGQLFDLIDGLDDRITRKENE